MALYTDIVMDHFMHPRNVGEIPNADGVGDLAHIAGMGEVIHYNIGIKCHDRSLLTL